LAFLAHLVHHIGNRNSGRTPFIARLFLVRKPVIGFVDLQGGGSAATYHYLYYSV